MDTGAKCSDATYNGAPLEWRTLGVADPGSGGPWEWRTLGVAGRHPLLHVHCQNTRTLKSPGSPLQHFSVTFGTFLKFFFFFFSSFFSSVGCADDEALTRLFL